MSNGDLKKQLEVLLKFSDSGVSKGLDAVGKQAETVKKSASEIDFATSAQAANRPLENVQKGLSAVSVEAKGARVSTEQLNAATAEGSKALQAATKDLALAGTATSAYNKESETLNNGLRHQQQVMGESLKLYGDVATATGDVTTGAGEVTEALGAQGAEATRARAHTSGLNAEVSKLTEGIQGVTYATHISTHAIGRFGSEQDVLTKIMRSGIEKTAQVAHGIGNIGVGATQMVQGVALGAAAVKGLNDDMTTTTQKAGDFGAAMDKGGDGLMNFGAGMELTGRASERGAKAVNMLGKGFVSVIKPLAMTGAVVGSFGKGVDDVSLAMQNGESVTRAVIKAIADLAIKIAFLAAVFTGGTTAAIALAVRALMLLAGVAKKAADAVWDLAKRAVSFLWQSLKDLPGAVRAAADSLMAFLTEAGSKINTLMTALPGPISNAYGVMKGAVTGVTGAAKTSLAAFGLLTGGFAALSAEMAGVDSIANSFSLSMKKLDVDGKQLLKTMNEQSLGLISQTEIMEKSNRATAMIGKDVFETMGGFDETLTRMVKVSMAAARSTGQNVEHMFDAIVTGVGRASPQILDNLGVQLRAGETYEKFAKSIGKKATALTMAERKIALLTETLRQGEIMVDNYGISTGGVGTQLQRLEVTLKDVAFTLSRTFMDPLKSMLDSVNILVGHLKLLVPFFEKLWTGFEMISPTIRDSIIAISSLGLVVQLFASGPGQQLLSVLGLSPDYFNYVVQSSGFVVVAMIALTSAYRDNFLGFQDFARPLVEFPGRVQGLISILDGNLSGAVKRMGSEALLAGEGYTTMERVMAQAVIRLRDSVMPQVHTVIGGVSQLGLAFKDMLTGDFERGINRVNELVLAIRMSVQDGIASIIDIIGKAGGDTFSRLPGLVQQMFERVYTTIMVGLPVLLSGAADIVTQLGEAITLGIRGLAGSLVGIGARVGSWLADGMKGGFSALGSSVTELASAVLTQTGKIFGSLASLFTAAYVELGKIIAAAGGPILAAIADMLIGVGKALPGLVAGISDMLIDGFTGMMQAIAGLFADDGGQIANAARGSLDGVGASIGDGLRELWHGIVDALAVGRDRWVAAWESWQPYLIQWWERLGPIIAWGRELLVQALSVLIIAILKVLRDASALVWEEIKEWFGAAARDKVNGEIDRIFREMISAVGLFSPDLMEKMYEAGVSVAQSFKDGLQVLNSWEAVGDWLSGFGGGAGAAGVSAPDVDWAGVGSGGSGKGFGDLGDKIRVPRMGGTRKSLGDIGAGLWDSVFNKPEKPVPDSIGGEDEGEGGDKGGGKGGKKAGAGGGKGGEGSKKDPLQEAMQAISTVASGIQAGLGALKAVWTDFIGAPPDEMMDRVFLALEGLLDRAIQLASGALSVEQAEGVKAGIDVISGIAGAIQNAVDATTAVFLVRTPPQGKIDEVFLLMGSLAELGIDMAKTLMTGNLQEAVKNLTLSREFADLVGGWAHAMSATAEGTAGAARARTDVDLNGLKDFFVRVVDLGFAVTEHMKILGDVTLLPARINESEMVAASIGTWLANLASVGESTQALARMRFPSDLSPVKDLLAGVLRLGEDLTAEFLGIHGTEFMIVAEDMRLVSEAVNAWVAPITGIADAAQAIFAARSDTDFGILGTWLPSLLGSITAAIATLNPATILRTTDDMVALGEALNAWVGPLSGMAGATEGLTIVAARRLRPQPIITFLDGLFILLKDLADRHIDRTVVGGLAIFDDMIEMATALNAWIGPLSSLQGALGAMEGVAFSHMFQGGRVLGLSDAFDLLETIGTETFRFYEQVSAGGGMKRIREIWSDSQEMAFTFTSWVSTLAVLGDILPSLRSVAGASGLTMLVQSAFDALGEIAAGSWDLIKDGAHSPEVRDMQALSTSIAGTLSAWIGVFVSMADFSIALRNTRADQLQRGDLITRMSETMSLIAELTWGTAGSPGLVQVIAGAPDAERFQGISATIASTVAAWVDTFATIAEFSRVIPVFKPVSPNVLGGITTFISSIKDVADEALKLFENEVDPDGRLNLMGNVASVIGGWAGSLGDIAGLSREIVNFIEPTGDEWARIERAAHELWTRFSSFGEKYIDDILVWSMDVAPKIDQWAAAVGAISSAVQAVAGVQLFGYFAPIEREWASVETALKDLWAKFSGIAQDVMPDLVIDGQEMADKIALWASSVGSIADTIMSVASIALFRENVAILDQVALDRIKGNLSMIMSTFESMATDWAASHRIPAVTAGEVGLWSSSISALITAASEAMGLAQFLSGEKVPKTPREGTMSQIRATMRAVFGMYNELMEELFGGIKPVAGTLSPRDPNRAAAERDQLLGSLSFLSGTISEMSGGITGIVELLATLADNGHKMFNISGAVKSVLKGAMRDIVNLFTELGQDFDIGSVASRDALARTAGFASDVANIVAPLQTVADTILALDNFLWESFQATEGQTAPKADTRLKYGSRPPSAVSDSGTKRFKRMIDVSRESIRQILAMAKVFVEEIRRAMDEVEADFMVNDPLGEFNKLLADIQGFNEVVTGSAAAIQSVAETIWAVMDSPLTVILFGTRGRAVGRTNMRIREVQAQHQANLIKASIKRMLKTIIDGIKEAFVEIDAEGGLPEQQIMQQIYDLSQSIANIANAIMHIMELPDIDLSKIETFAEAARRIMGLLGVIVPSGGGGGGGSFDTRRGRGRGPDSSGAESSPVRERPLRERPLPDGLPTFSRPGLLDGLPTFSMGGYLPSLPGGPIAIPDPGHRPSSIDPKTIGGYDPRGNQGGDIFVDVQDGDTHLEAVLQFPDAAYPIIAEIIRKGPPPVVPGGGGRGISIDTKGERKKKRVSPYGGMRPYVRP